MLTFNPNTPKSRPEGHDKPLLLLALCFVWIVTGLWGHDPWKSDELAQIGLISHFFNHGLGLIPTLGGEPLLQTPPLYFWLATLLGHVLSPWLLPLHDAARLTTGLFMAVTILGVGQATRLLYADNTGRVAILTLIGSIGMVVWGHFLSNEVTTIAGVSLILWACAAALTGKPYRIVLLVIGTSIIFWSGSLFQACLALALPFAFLLSRFWRTPLFIKTILLALPLTLLIAALWPLLLWFKSPELLWQWIGHDGSLRLMLAPFAPDGLSYYLRRLPWLALPALPLAAWSLWRKWPTWGAAEHGCLIAFVVWLAALTLTNQKQDILAMPLLLPLAILSGGGIDSLRRGAASAMNWFGRLAFGIFGLYAWVVWAGANLGFPQRLSQQARLLAPDFHPSIQPIAICIALLFSGVWIWAIFLKRPLARQAITNWALGITLLWGLVVALTLPWFNAVKSYKTMSIALIKTVPNDYQCIDINNIGNSIAGALAYYGDLQLRHGENAAYCPVVLIRLDSKSVEHGSSAPGPLLWHGSPSWSRGKETYQLYRRLAK